MKKVLTIISLFFLLATFGCNKSIPEKMYVSATKGVILRSEPDSNSNKIASVPFMTEVQTIEQKKEKVFLAERYGNWTKVKFDNNEGWIFSGFLCEFKIDKLLEIASQYHAEKFKKTECVMEMYKKNETNKAAYGDFSKLVLMKPSDIEIKTILNNFIVIQLPLTSFDTCAEVSPGNELWFFDTVSKTFKIKKEVPEGKSHWMDLVYLNNDDIPDYTITGGCCGSWETEISLGDKNGDFISNKKISCSDDSANTSDPLCDKQKLKEYYSKI